MNAQDLFRGLVVSNPPRLRPKSRLGIGSSVVFHGAGITAILLVPILASDDLPRAHGAADAMAMMAPIVVLPPAPLPLARPLINAPVPRPADAARHPPRPDTFTVPVVIPDHIEPEPPPLPVDLDFPTAEDEAAAAMGSVLDQLVTDPDVPPKLVKKTLPVFPEKAAGAVAAGRVRVLVEILIGADGRVLRYRILESVPLLDDAAARCVQEWVFEPAQKRGRKVPTRTTVAVHFDVETR